MVSRPGRSSTRSPLGGRDSIGPVRDDLLDGGPLRAVQCAPRPARPATCVLVASCHFRMLIAWAITSANKAIGPAASIIIGSFAHHQPDGGGEVRQSDDRDDDAGDNS